MKLTKVDKIPELSISWNKESPRHPTKVLEDFLANPDITFARVDYDPDEYIYPHSCRSSFAMAAERSGLPVKVYIRQGVVYLAKEWYDEY